MKRASVPGDDAYFFPGLIEPNVPPRKGSEAFLHFKPCDVAERARPQKNQGNDGVARADVQEAVAGTRADEIGQKQRVHREAVAAAALDNLQPAHEEWRRGSRASPAPPAAP